MEVVNEKSKEALLEMFRVSHNVPSTPAHSVVRPSREQVSERTIWAYWAQGVHELPDLFRLCVQTWRHHNPDWDICVLDNTSLKDYLSDVDLPNRFRQMLSPQCGSDCIRLALLSRYGGVWMDVSIILRTSLDDLCWRALDAEEISAAAFYHPDYGTESLGGKDFVESWFLATKANNPFFLKWRDALRELFQNRLDTPGLLSHPLYTGLDLSGINRLNTEFEVPFDFREYLAIHAMCHRVLETDQRLRRQWRENWLMFDAADTAFKIQRRCDEDGERIALVLLGGDARSQAGRGDIWDEIVGQTPLIKLRTPDYAQLVQFPAEVNLDERGVLGRQLRASGAASDSVQTIGL